MATYVLGGGAWLGGWCWQPIARHLSKKLESIVVPKTIAVCSEQMTRNPTNT
jgi:hypothetical protein